MTDLENQGIDNSNNVQPTEGDTPTETPTQGDVSLTPESSEPTGLDALNEKIAKATSGEADDEPPKPAKDDEIDVDPEQKADSETEKPETQKTDSDESKKDWDLSYKVRDEELKMDDWVKDKIENEDDLKKFQDLYTRGHGLEIAKKERDDYKTQLSEVDTNLKYLADAVNKGRVDEFIETLGLPKEQFINYAIQELKYREMPAEERAKVDEQKRIQQYQRQLEMQNQQMQQQYDNEQKQRLNLEIDTTLNNGEYKDIAQNYDQRVGKPGAFRNLVVERGIFHEITNGRQITVQEAAQEAAQIIGGFQAGTQNLSQQSATAGTQPATKVRQEKKPVLPNVQGQGTSPTKRMPTSVDDLRKRHKELTGQL